MLTVWRRHRKKCPHKLDRYYRKCRCSCWAEGTCESQYVRHSLKTRSWERAIELARAIEDRKPDAPISVPKQLSISEAIDRFMDDAKHGRKLRPASIKKYRVLTDQLKAYAEKAGVIFVKQIDVNFMRQFRATWKDGPISAGKKLERAKAFCRWLVQSGDLALNPATPLRPPSCAHEAPTMPIPDSDIAKALDKCNDPRWFALILVLRWSGLRIGDAMQLTPQKLDGNRLFLRTEKTGTPVFIPLPPEVISALDKLPLYGGFYFWNRAGESKLDTATGNARRAFRRIFQAAGVKDAHPHRLRDSFAVSLLEKGVSVEVVAKLLGHSSVKITEKHYSPWCRALQLTLEREVAKTWEQPKLVRVK